MVSLETVIEEESKLMLNLIESGPITVEDEDYLRKGRIVSFPDFLNPAFVNAFISMLIGHPLPPEQRLQLHKVFKNGKLFQNSSDFSGRLLALLPWIRHFAPVSSGYSGSVKSHQVLLDFVQVSLELDRGKSWIYDLKKK